MSPTTDTTVHPRPQRPSTGRRTRAGRRSLIAALLALGVLAAGCSDSDSDDGNDSGSTPDTPMADGVPKECSIYPFAMEPADPDEITLTPDRWPSPPSGATLCVTSSAIGSSTEVAEYALAAEPETILGYYEAQLSGPFEVEREAGIGAGEILTGYDDTVGFQIVTRDGGFKIAFAEL